MIRALQLLLLLGLLKTYVHAQEIPLGAWESHFSYQSAQHILEAKNKIFCSSYNGLFSIDPVDDKIHVFSKANGLSDTGINSMAYDSTANLLLLAYRNGNLDLLYLNDKAEPTEIINWPFLQNATDLPETKSISKIVFWDEKAYLSTNFGIIVINPKLREVVENYRYIGPNGSEVQVIDMTFTPDSLFLATSEGLLGASLQPNVNRQFFANWKTVPTPYKVIATSYQHGSLNAVFAGQGLFKRNNSAWDLIYSSSSTNSSFSKNLATLSNRILVLDKEKTDVYENPLFRSLRESILYKQFFWTADNRQGLLSNKGGAFKSYTPFQGDTTITIQSDSTITDLNGLIWTRLPTYLGGGISVKNPGNNQQRILSVSAGNGGLPSSTINSLAIDTDGFIWFASDRGVGYFFPDDILSSARQDAVLPVYGQRKLFSNERCNAIAVEPGNRKWIATDNGLFQFTADGTELIKEFNRDNSPLPANQIKDLFFENEKGLLFADTPNGMVSYRSDATSARENLSAITIFPNPVRPGYEGNLGLKGLTDNAVVKITDLSGRLVFETRSQGGSASWNLND
jgi:hypothetical protein